MSKKFLTIFALVALLVAAMAGSAFAGIGPVEVTRSKDEGNNMGAIKPAVIADGLENGWSTTVYYLKGETDANLVLSVSMDLTSETAFEDAKSIDIVISTDVLEPILVDVLSDEFDGAYVSFDFPLSTDASIKGFIGAVSYDSPANVVHAASFDVTFEEVALLGDGILNINMETLPVGKATMTNINSYDFGTGPELWVSADTKIGPIEAKKVVATDPVKSGDIVVSFDKTTGTIFAAISGDISDDLPVTLIISADDFLVSADEDAEVAGFKGVVASLVVTASKAAPVPPVGVLKFTPESGKITFTALSEDLYVIEVSQDKFLGEAITSVEITPAASMFGLTAEQREADKPNKFAIYGEPEALTTAGETVKLTVKALVGTETLSDVYEFKIVPAYVPPTPPADFLNVSDATQEKLEELDITLISKDVFDQALLDGDIATMLQSNSKVTKSFLDDYKLLGNAVSINLEVLMGGGNAVPVDFHNTNIMGGISAGLNAIEKPSDEIDFEEETYRILEKSFDVYYEYVSTDKFDGFNGEPRKIIGSGGTISWRDAIKNGIVKLDWISDTPTMNIKYIAVDMGYKAPAVVNDEVIVIYDGDGDDGYIRDPMWVAERKNVKDNDGGSSVGCDAGFGVFALLGLAGMAVILRKKD